MGPEPAPAANEHIQQAPLARRMKSYRTTALLVLAAVFGFEILHTHLGRSAPAVGVSPAVRQGPARPRALRMADLSAFRLGKMSADYSALLRLHRQNQDPAGDARQVATLDRQLRAALQLMRIPVKVERLDFDWPKSSFTAPAYDILRQSLALQYDQHTSMAYQLGVELMSARWRAVSLEAPLAARSAGAPLASSPGRIAESLAPFVDLQGVLTNLRTQSTAVFGKFDFARFQPSVAVTDLLRTPDGTTGSMLLQIYSLDLAGETLLAQ